MPERKTGVFRFIALAGLKPADPDPTALAANLATSDEPARQTMLPAKAGRRRETPLLFYGRSEAGDAGQTGAGRTASAFRGRRQTNDGNRDGLFRERRGGRPRSIMSGFARLSFSYPAVVKGGIGPVAGGRRSDEVSSSRR